MTDFVKDNTFLPAGKKSTVPIVGDTTYFITPGDWNTLVAAVLDIRSYIKQQFYSGIVTIGPHEKYVVVEHPECRTGSKVFANLQNYYPEGPSGVNAVEPGDKFFTIIMTGTTSNSINICWMLIP